WPKCASRSPWPRFTTSRQVKLKRPKLGWRKRNSLVSGVGGVFGTHHETDSHWSSGGFRRLHPTYQIHQKGSCDAKKNCNIAGHTDRGICLVGFAGTGPGPAG